MCRDINESVCPWDTFGGEGKERKSPRGSVGSGGGSHKRRGSDPTISTSARGSGGASGGGALNPSDAGASPHHGKHRPHHQSVLGDGKTCTGSGGATVKSCSATRTSSLENSLERSGSCRRRQTDGRGSLQEDGSSGHHHHHHHHHHGHGAGTSRRSKNRSKRKKTSVRSSTLTSAGELAAAIAAAATATSCTTTTTSTQFNAPSMTSHQQTDHGKGHHQPPHHQHSASSLLSSVVAPASVLMVTQSFERMAVGISIPPLVIPPVPNPDSDVTTTGPATTSSKCTQTKVCSLEIIHKCSHLLASDAT